MLTRWIDLCLRHRPVVLVATIVLVGIGVASLQRLPFDAFPDTTPPLVQINAAAPALSPLEIERQLTIPIEQAIAGLPRLREVRSLSKFGFTQVTAIFADGTDIWFARQVVSERLDEAVLPDGVERPSLGPVATGLGEVFQYLVESDELGPEELRTLHHWVVRPRLLEVSGVAEVNTWGGLEKQYHVVVDPARLVKHALTLDDVARILRRDNRNAAGGVVDLAGEALLVQGQGLVSSAADLERMVVASVDGRPVLLRDVADVRIGHEIRRGAVTANGTGEVVLGLGFMLMGENSRDVTHRLEARLAEVAQSLPDGMTLTPVYSRSDLVDAVLGTVRTNLFEGALLVVAVLFVFLGNLRAGLIVAAAIPLSLLFAGSAMLQLGIAGSLMSLGAIDFGLVVDSSVVMVENATRRLADDGDQRSVREIVRDAAVEVRRPTLFGELIIAIVYLPILALEGVEGDLFRPMAVTVILALAGSMLLSLTLVPVLASYALQRGSAGSGAEPRVVRALQRLYRPVLALALRRRVAVLVGSGVLLVGAAFLATRLGSEFVPRLREQALVINTVRMAGISLDESVRYGLQVERLLLREFPDEIAQVWTRTGTAEVATDPMGTEVSDVFLTLHPRDRWTRARTQDELVLEMSGVLTGLPGMRSVFSQPIEMRTNEMLAGIRADVGVAIYGEDFDVLRTRAEEVRGLLEGIPGAADIAVEQLTGQSVVAIAVDREAAARYAIGVGEVLGAVEALGTRPVGEVFEGQRRFDLVLRVGDDTARSPESLERLLLRTASGALVPLGAVADVSLVEGPSTIQRQWGQRRITVQANVRGRDLGSFVGEVRSALHARIDLPVGYHLGVGGQFEHFERARARLALVVPLALLLVFSLLYMTYGRVADALRVFTGVPFAAVGGIAALWLRDLPFSVSAGVGFIALSGVAVFGDMVLVSRVRQLQESGMAALDAIREAAETRLRPVLMTALVAALGFVPMAFNTGLGAEVQRPLATVVIGGMVTSTAATLVLLPVLYAVFGRRDALTGTRRLE
jgi:cobalt-zinc-cadmium resistance protein CzcA